MDFGPGGLGRFGATALAIAALLLAGCADAVDDPEEPSTDVDDGSVPDTMTIRGIVQDASFVPVADAVVTVMERNLTTTTGADGRFVFEDLPIAFYTVEADATDLVPQTLTARPGAEAELLFTLARFAEEPYHQTVPFHGIIRCAAEYFIITPSCDTLLEYAAENGAPLPDGGNVVDDEAEFDLATEANWRTLVVDVDFDPDSHPGIAGLRTVVQGSNDPSELGSYQQYGRFHDETSYSFRLEPGQEYAEGDVPVPFNATGLRFNIYPHSHGWHAVCDATGEASTCTLGIGAAVDLEFDLFVTAFYVDPAPEGWSLL